MVVLDEISGYALSLGDGIMSACKFYDHNEARGCPFVLNI